MTASALIVSAQYGHILVLDDTVWLVISFFLTCLRSTISASAELLLIGARGALHGCPSPLGKLGNGMTIAKLCDCPPAGIVALPVPGCVPVPIFHDQAHTPLPPAVSLGSALRAIWRNVANLAGCAGLGLGTG